MRLLVSVRNVDEARAALAGGADLVDVKEPNRGPLGMANPATIAAIADAVQEHERFESTTSATLGELREWDDPARTITLAALPDLLKVGLAGEANRPDWPTRWAALRGRVSATPRTQWVAVVYADFETAHAPDPASVIEWCVTGGARVVLFDTFDKSNGGLLDTLGDHLPRLVERARTAGCEIALAGKVTLADLPHLVSLAPDVIAVRSAVCANGDRANGVEAHRVRSFRAAMSERSPD